MFVRTATKDTELRGVRVNKGDRAAMFYPSANRDETQFADPDHFDVSRTPNPHMRSAVVERISASARS